MSRYIDADKIISHLNDEIEACENPDVYSQPVAYGTYLGLQYARSIVETAEAANVVQVVRCKDCAVPLIERCWGECCRPFGEDGVTQETAENDFCSFAKEATYESLCKQGC